MQTVSVDIGSTWTKAALFAHEGEELTLVNHVLTPTTTHHLADGFFASLNQVLNVADARPLLKSGEVQLKYSSSAKGGLAVCSNGAGAFHYVGIGKSYRPFGRSENRAILFVQAEPS